MHVKEFNHVLDLLEYFGELELIGYLLIFLVTWIIN